MTIGKRVATVQWKLYVKKNKLLHYTITICSVDITPKYELKQMKIDELINFLPPFLPLDNFNVYSTLWVCNYSNHLGCTIKSVLETFNLSF